MGDTAWRPVVCLAFGLVTSSCGDRASDAVPGVSVRDSAGVEIVENGQPPLADTLTATETLRLGVVDGGGPEQFADVRDVVLASEGRIVVANNGSTSVRVFTAAGTFVAEFGGEGQGPAEVTTLNQVVASGDTVMLVDWQRSGKAALFTAEGAFIDSWSLTLEDRGRVWPQHAAPGGWFVQVIPPYRPPPLSVGEPWQRVAAVHVVGSSGEDLGPVLFQHPLELLYGVEGVEGEVDRALLPRRWRHGFDASGRFFLTHPESYGIDVYDASGLVRIVRRQYQPRPYTDRDVDDIIEATVHVIDTMSRLPVEMRIEQRAPIRERAERQARLPRLATIPPIGDLLVSSDGSFWVRRADAQPPRYTSLENSFGHAAAGPALATTWDLFDANGRYRGTVVLPARFRAEGVDGLTVVGVTYDQFDVEYVVRYEIGGLSD